MLICRHNFLDTFTRVSFPGSLPLGGWHSNTCLIAQACVLVKGTVNVVLG